MNVPSSSNSHPTLRMQLSDPEIEALHRWWSRLQSDKATGQDRADRARLRRCHDLTAVACTAAFGRHAAERGAKRAAANLPPYSDRQLERLALIVGLAAHLRPEGAKTLPEAMRFGRTKDKGPIVSELRFQRLVAGETPDALFVGLRRVLPLVDGQVSLRSVAQDLFGWGDVVRKRWVYAYYAEDTPPNSAATNIDAAPDAARAASAAA